MGGAVRIDVHELPQAIRRVMWCDQTAVEVVQGIPLRVEGVGVIDIEVDAEAVRFGSWSAHSVRWSDTDPRSTNPYRSGPS